MRVFKALHHQVKIRASQGNIAIFLITNLKKMDHRLKILNSFKA